MILICRGQETSVCTMLLLTTCISLSGLRRCQNEPTPEFSQTAVQALSNCKRKTGLQGAWEPQNMRDPLSTMWHNTSSELGQKQSNSETCNSFHKLFLNAYCDLGSILDAEDSAMIKTPSLIPGSFCSGLVETQNKQLNKCSNWIMPDCAKCHEDHKMVM